MHEKPLYVKLKSDFLDFLESGSAYKIVLTGYTVKRTSLSHSRS